MNTLLRTAVALLLLLFVGIFALSYWPTPFTAGLLDQLADLAVNWNMVEALKVLGFLTIVVWAGARFRQSRSKTRRGLYSGIVLIGMLILFVRLAPSLSGSLDHFHEVVNVLAYLFTILMVAGMYVEVMDSRTQAVPNRRNDGL